MRLAIDTGCYRSAMDTLYGSNQDLTDAILAMAGILDGCAAMAGDDTGGRSWSSSYDAVASDMVQAGADLAGSMGAMANLLNASLVNHEGADFGARLEGPPYLGSDDGDTDPHHWTERLQPARLPSAAGGSGSPPGGWEWLVEHLEGYLWPNADTAKMRSAGNAWAGGARTLSAIGWSVEVARTDIESQRSPEVPAATAACTELRGHCDDLAAAYRDVGRACQDYADQVEEHHREIIATCEELLAWTVVDQATGAILSFFTAGAAEVAAQLVEAGIMARYAARVISILKRLVELARAAAAVISRGVARVAEILARLRKFLSARVARALEKVGGAALQKELAAIRTLLADSERAGGHTIARHVGRSDAELTARLTGRRSVRTSSTFTDQASAERAIAQVMKDQRTAVDNWVAGAGRKLELDGDAGQVIGRAISRGDASTTPVSKLRVVLVRDATMPDGYKILTAFPKP